MTRKRETRYEINWILESENRFTASGKNRGDKLGGGVFVKLVLAIIQPTKLDAVRNALEKIGVESMTVCDARGYARHRGHSPTYRGHEYKANLLRKITLEIAVHDDRVERVIETVSNVARTGPEGTIGDGKIFLLPLDDVIRISDVVRGPEAVS